MKQFWLHESEPGRAALPIVWLLPVAVEGRKAVERAFASGCHVGAVNDRDEAQRVFFADPLGG